uniref:TIR domain-containing protein n=1 Tax=Nelumbo nucifera TaxID=4432 RepID=A0A822ZJ32_NELNU|nr:TPA_asm: hypothetical protein HUJ06_004334 [Nelumbo nucifera]
MAAKMTQEASFSNDPRWNYDVFLSFRGEDTRKSFTDHLYNALVQRGIHTFRDDEKLKRGEDIASELHKTIEESRISIIVFSRNYASSRWCMDELVKILECRKMMGQLVLPVFYDVHPSDVRKQTGSFAEAFAKHEEHFRAAGTERKVQKWKEALVEAADVSGWDLQSVTNGHQSMLIQGIAEEVLTKLSKTLLDVAVYPIGIDSRARDMYTLLSIRPDDVRIVGIWGMGGIGKTTIAKAIYNQIFGRFEGGSFLANVAENFKQHNGIVQLQEQLLLDILMVKDLKIKNIASGSSVIKERLCYKKVLLVLDHVDQPDQLYALAREHNWFGAGSRIIITTRDVHLLNVLQVDEIYEAKELSYEESIKLFSWHAFGKDHPTEDYMELSKRVVSYVGGLPLALEVLGSFLLDKRSKPEWISVLEKLKRIPHDQIQKKLRISFDALDDQMRDIFLDIACFFIGMDRDHVIRILDGCGFFSETGINDLIRKSLLKVGENNELRMHDQIRDMGREIIREKSPKEPGSRSRLWYHEDVHHVLTQHSGTEAVEGLILSKIIDETLSTKAFEKMHNLRLLQLNHIHLKGSYEYFPKNLRWLCWHGFPLRYIPTNIHLESLVILDMQYSKMEQVWKEIKVPLKNLKLLNLSHSKYLTQTPNFLVCPNLEILNLENCENLVKIHHSIGNLSKLALLNLKNCRNIRKLPSSISQLTSLKDLILFGCPKLVTLPSKSRLSSVRSWALLGRKDHPHSITQLPISFSYLSSLERLDLSHCNLPESAIPSDLGNLSSLKVLHLSYNNFSNLPASMNRLSQLKEIFLENCRRLQSIPELPPSLQLLNANGCTSLETISNLGSLTSLTTLRLCKTSIYNLPSIAQLSHLGYLEIKECPKLQTLLGLPSYLLRLNLEGCTSIERLNLSNLRLLSDFYVTNCTELAEIQLPATLEHSRVIGQRQQQRFDVLFPQKRFDIFLPGSEIPEGIKYQSMGSVISFEVPPAPVMDQQIRLQGLTICAAYATNEDPDLFGVPPVVGFANIVNKTKGLEWKLLPQFSYAPRMASGAHIWVSHRSDTWIQSCLEVGDRVEVSIVCEGGRHMTTKCGVHLVYFPTDEGDGLVTVDSVRNSCCQKYLA